MKAISELNNLSINLHIIFIFLTIFVIARLILLFLKELEYQKFSKIYERWILFFRALLGAVIFSGVVVMATMHFHVRWQVWLMSLFTLYLFVATINETLIYKNINLKSSTQKSNFCKKMKKRYLISLILIVFVMIVSAKNAIFI